MTNPLRGEVALTLAGRDYTLRPTFNALKRIEAATGKKLVEIIGGLNGITVLAIVVAELIRAGADEDAFAKAATADKVGDLILETGMLDVARITAEALTGALLGGKKPGEGQAADGSSA